MRAGQTQTTINIFCFFCILIFFSYSHSKGIGGAGGGGAGAAAAGASAAAAKPNIAMQPATFGNSTYWSTTYGVSSYGGGFYNIIADYLVAEALLLHTIYENRLYSAQTNLELAKAMREDIVTQRNLLLVERFQDEQASIYEKELHLNKKIKNIKKHGKHLDLFKIGITSKNTFKALNFFISDNLILPIEWVEKALFEKIPPLSQENFIPNPKSIIPVKPFPGGKFVDLLEFLNTNNFSIYRYTLAHMYVLDFLDGLYEHTEKAIYQSFSALDSMKQKLYSSWHIKIKE